MKWSRADPENNNRNSEQPVPTNWGAGQELSREWGLRDQSAAGGVGPGTLKELLVVSTRSPTPTPGLSSDT